MRPRVALALIVVALLAAPARAAAEAPLTLGMQDPFAFQGELQGPQLGLALERARAAGSSLVRLGVSWRAYQTRKPESRAEARDPRWKGYDWSEVDGEVRSVVAAGMRPLLAVGIAPRWFEGPNRPSDSIAPPGTWRPNATALGDFAHALAERFSGSSRDADGSPLPRVRYFQAWNEPNISPYMTPQVDGASVDHYRGMLRAFYAEVKRVHADNFVSTGGLAPFGRLPLSDPGAQYPPVYFTRKLLCVNSKGTRARRCARVPFDAYALHAYPQADPRERPRNPGDIRLRVNSIASALRLAARAGTISARQARSIWVTELGFAGGGDGPSVDTQATWIQLSLYMLWREGVDAVVWWNLRDRAQPVFMQRSGLFERGDSVEADRAKPAYTAFRFPLVFVRSGGRARVWGRAPGTGTVVIEKEVYGGGFERVASVTAGGDHVFSVTAPDPGSARLRARQGSDTSLLTGVTDPPP